VILDLCGGTGSWSAPYREAGHDVLIVDPVATGDGAVPVDVRLWQPPRGLRVHGILAAPPCTHLAGSGARWWAGKGDAALLDALSIADACLRLIVRYQPDWWALENPVGRLSRYLGPPVLTFDPWQYGHPTIKRTCLWGRFATPIGAPVVPVDGQVVWRMGPSADRARLRSITPEPVARAFAEATTPSHRHAWHMVSIADDGRVLDGCSFPGCVVTRVVGRAVGFWDELETARDLLPQSLPEGPRDVPDG
jgi:hypothetical protein